MSEITQCPCCGNTTFEKIDILWPDLIKAWELKKPEIAQINRQQGLSCSACHSNLRSMTLAAAIMKCYGFRGNLQQFTKKYKKLRVLEVNEAGHLNPFLKELRHHTLASYPEVDIMELPYDDNLYDLIVHSDTLEHVTQPVRALQESLRVLRPGGFTCYTVPLVIGRLTQVRRGKPDSFHGTPGNDEYLVHTEYGSDAWTQAMEAGFEECRLVAIDYPASVALIGAKP